MRRLALDNFERVGFGLKRPEDVAIDARGRVFASDQASAVAEVTPDGGLVRYGDAGGQPNGINLDLKGRMVIANMALACVQILDFASNRTEILVDHIGDRPLLHCNYPLVDSQGRVWISCCTREPETLPALASGVADGFIARYDPDGKTQLVADKVRFPNSMALDAAGTHLYVARTGACDVHRFEILGDGRLGPEEPYGPRLGTGLADGIAFDAEGNLWVTILKENRIVAITPGLDLVDVVADPDGETVLHPTSITWGGDDMRDVYIGSTLAGHLVKARCSVAGQASPAQAAAIAVGIPA